MTTKNIHIRRARPVEAETLTKIAFAAKRYWNYPEAYIELWRDDLTFTAGYIETYPVYVATAQGQAIGVYSLVAREEIQELDYLWVHPDYIGQGVGRKLAQHAVNLAKSGGSQILMVVSDPNAVGFYEKMGFRWVKNVPGQPAGRTLPLLEMDLSATLKPRYAPTHRSCPR